jgi:hypothetical protein
MAMALSAFFRLWLKPLICPRKLSPMANPAASSPAWTIRLPEAKARKDFSVAR